MPRKPIIVAAFFGLLLFAPAAIAQTYPDRPVRLLVPFTAGSSTDQVARLLGNELQNALGQPFVIDNRPGALGSVAAEAVAKSSPDGYTLMLTTNSALATNVSLFSKLAYDPVKDFAPIARIGITAFVLMTKPDFPAKSIAELIALAKAEPGKLSGGFGGGGGQVSQALLKAMAHLEVTDVPYRGVPQAVTDTLGGSVGFSFVDLGNAGALVKSGQLKALGQTLPHRTDLAPGVPAISETLPGYEVVAWFGLVAPAGTPPDVVKKLYDTTKTALAKPDVQRGIALTGTEIAVLDPVKFSDFIKSEIPKWAQLAKLAGLRAD
ncbi:MAG TPA: tripartite tricarboxylate transporter substrate-binding protein [Xanthobacteraceae bacterium]|jgi:tripartite-type tricarboxylate transporter receptor subunit TctC|nr:tripartite tricarboxylate transporter substrate-binding protein [Xanthobacteraceae bacterium]